MANIVQANEKASVDLANKFPGMAPHAIVNLSNAIQALTQLSSAGNFSQSFKSKSTAILKTEQSRITSFREILKNLNGDNFPIVEFVFESNKRRRTE